MNEEKFNELIILIKLGQEQQVNTGNLSFYFRYSCGTLQFRYKFKESAVNDGLDHIWFNLSYTELRNLLIDGF